MTVGHKRVSRAFYTVVTAFIKYVPKAHILYLFFLPLFEKKFKTRATTDNLRPHVGYYYFYFSSFKYEVFVNIFNIKRKRHFCALSFVFS